VGLSRDGLALLALGRQGWAGAFELAAAGVAGSGWAPDERRWGLLSVCATSARGRRCGRSRADSACSTRAGWRWPPGGAAARPDARAAANAHKLMRLALRFEAAEGRDLRASSTTWQC
jgi:hypothetical protein